MPLIFSSVVQPPFFGQRNPISNGQSLSEKNERNPMFVAGHPREGPTKVNKLADLDQLFCGVSTCGTAFVTTVGGSRSGTAPGAARRYSAMTRGRCLFS